ncbi:MAG: winged helix DNA-binding domain-containing protein [Dehalococcoidia bacterium]|nr:winged helix DNA-binding domain-containing protein [Dehalococcoidia bacterium]
MPDVLTTRQLNRALLQRQLLLERVEMPPLAVAEHLVGMQAQEPGDPYVGLWTRVASFDPEDLSRAIEQRQAVRMPLMRSTLHLVTADDALRLRPVIQPVLERVLYTGSPFGRQVAGADVEALLMSSREYTDMKPRTLSDLRKHIAEQWPAFDATSLAQAVHYLMPQVQIPPRGMWRRSGQATWAHLETWLGRPMVHDATPDKTVLRYLAAFGPAAPNDVQAWSGLTRVREVTERLRPRLRVFRDENRRELFDLPDAPLPDPDTQAPARFLPQYDNVFLAHADRARIVSEEDRKAAAVGVGPSLFLVDGFVAGTWRIRTEADKATLLMQPFRPLAPDDEVQLLGEADRLVTFVSTSASYDLRVLPPP